MRLPCGLNVELYVYFGRDGMKEFWSWFGDVFGEVSILALKSMVVGMYGAFGAMLTLRLFGVQI